MRNSSSISKIGSILGAIAHLIRHPLGVDGDKKIQSLKREYHYAIGGGNPEFHPRRTRFKGWQRENRRHNSKLYR